MRRSLVWGSLAIAGLVLLDCLGLGVLIDFALTLAFGWVVYLWRVIPRVTIDWGGVAMGLVCLILFAVGSHAFLKWLAASIRGVDRPWTPRRTVAVVAVVVLMFVAGISATGVAHQVGWLLISPEPWVGAEGSGWMAARRAQSMNNLKQMAVGLDNYSDERGVFPPGGTFDAHGQPLHGWQTMVLPYIEQSDLYNQVHLDIPWDDPRNAPPFRTVLNVYLNPGIQSREDTNGAGYAPSHYAGNVRVLGGDIPRTLADVPDGTSVTLMAGEVAGRFRPWAHPTNWRDPAKGINRAPDGFGGPYPGGANMMFADGSVRFLKDSVDPRILRALSTPAGGEAISSSEY
jgi:prepilin-type processing-associated H-X9-DG protein